MADEKNIAQAKAAFDTFCKMLDELDWHYKKDEEELRLECGAKGEDLPIEISVRVDPDTMLVLVLSHIPFVIQENKRLDLAVAISYINNKLVDGCFDYDIAGGHIFFRITNSFIDSTISKEVFSYMIFASCHIIDEYNDKFLMLSKGMMTIEQFIAANEN